MTGRARRSLEQLSKNIRENSARIQRILRKAGVKPDPALVFSTAKYYKALNKLAKA